MNFFKKYPKDKMSYLFMLIYAIILPIAAIYMSEPPFNFDLMCYGLLLFIFCGSIRAVVELEYPGKFGYPDPIHNENHNSCSGINPATGLRMAGGGSSSVDVGGNSFGSSGSGSYDYGVRNNNHEYFDFSKYRDL